MSYVPGTDGKVDLRTRNLRMSSNVTVNLFGERPIHLCVHKDVGKGVDTQPLSY